MYWFMPSPFTFPPHLWHCSCLDSAGSVMQERKEGKAWLHVRVMYSSSCWGSVSSYTLFQCRGSDTRGAQQANEESVMLNIPQHPFILVILIQLTYWFMPSPFTFPPHLWHCSCLDSAGSVMQERRRKVRKGMTVMYSCCRVRFSSFRLSLFVTRTSSGP